MPAHRAVAKGIKVLGVELQTARQQRDSASDEKTTGSSHDILHASSGKRIDSPGSIPESPRSRVRLPATLLPGSRNSRRQQHQVGIGIGRQIASSKTAVRDQRQSAQSLVGGVLADRFVPNIQHDIVVQVRQQRRDLHARACRIGAVRVLFHDPREAFRGIEEQSVAST